MATTSYTIYSSYEPQERRVPDKFPQQLEQLDPDGWHFDPSLRSKPLPPRFVLASLPLDQDHWAHGGSTSSKQDSTDATLGTDVSLWYRSLRSLDSSEVHQPEPRPSNREAKPFATRQPLRSEKRNKNNWFIMKAIQSEPLSENAPSPSLADIIARDPPPLPAESKYEPPVWLEIGPANKGYGMLQRHGWSEGEPLGPDVVRHRHEQEPSSLEMIPLDSQKRKRDLVKQEMREFKLEGYDDVSEVRRVDVIDLAASDGEDKSAAAAPSPDNSVRDPDGLPVYPGPEHSAHNRTALLTPIPIVLKSDRLGIGLKAKTVGPYKASLKRVTHSAAALAAHIKAGEEKKKRKGEVGRGRRGYARQQKRDEADRGRLLAYMKD